MESVQEDTTLETARKIVVRLNVPTVGRSTLPGTAETARPTEKEANKEHPYGPPFFRRYRARLGRTHSGKETSNNSIHLFYRQ